MLTIGVTALQQAFRLVRRGRSASGSDTVPAGVTTCTAWVLARGGPGGRQDNGDGTFTNTGGRGGDMRSAVTFAVTPGQTVSYTFAAASVTLSYGGTTQAQAFNNGTAGTGGTRTTGGAGRTSTSSTGGNAGGGGAAGTTGNGATGTGGTGTGGVRGTGISFTDTETGTVYQNGAGATTTAGAIVAAGSGGGLGYSGTTQYAPGEGFVVLEYS